MRKVNIIILFSALNLITSNVIQSLGSLQYAAFDWQYSDVRYIDPVDTAEASPDIIAVLSRHEKESIQIRIDFLSLGILQDFNLSILIDSQPGGRVITEGEITKGDFAWEYKIEYHNLDQRLTIRDRDGLSVAQQLRLLLNVPQSYMVISAAVNKNTFDNRMSRILVLISTPKSSRILDYTSPIALSASPPPPLNLKLLFWNIMDSSTPATILRSWAGAHTGPQSSRHGLSYLFSAVERWQIPIGICDLYNRDTIFALNYLQSLPKVEDLLLNTLVQNELCYRNIDYAQSTGLDWPSNEVLLDQSSLITYLLERYFSGQNEYILLGGDFSKSIFGDPGMLEKICAFLSSHPWIRVVQRHQDPIGDNYGTDLFYDHQNDIPYTVNGQQFPSGLTNLDIQSFIKAELIKLSPNNISRLASEMYNDLLDSNNENIILALGSYLSQIGHIIEAAGWAEKPEVVSSCEKDIDWDGQPECVLSTGEIFLSFELEGGYLTFGFVKKENGYHQIIGPTTQFDILRSDTSMLSAEKGIAGDTGQIIGAFVDPLSAILTYTGCATSSSVVLTSQDGIIRKDFSIVDGGIKVTIMVNDHFDRLVSKLPIVLDPWLIYSDNPADIYWEQISQNSYIWGVSDQISIGIKSNAPYQQYSFDATYDALNDQEDPNFDYTIGHLLPIPMAFVEFQLRSVNIIFINIDL